MITFPLWASKSQLSSSRSHTIESDWMSLLAIDFNRWNSLRLVVIASKGIDYGFVRGKAQLFLRFREKNEQHENEVL